MLIQVSRRPFGFVVLALSALLGPGLALPVTAQEPESQPPAVEPAATGPQEVSVDEAGLFNLHLRRMPLPEALRMLSHQAQRNISVTESVSATVSADLYQVSFEEALEALVTPAGYTWLASGKFIYVCLPSERDGVLAANRATEMRIFELSFITAKDALPIVTELLSAVGKVVGTADAPVPGVSLTADSFDEALAAGLGGKSRAAGEFLIVRDYPEVLDEVAEVLGRLDVRPRQVLIEALILRVRLDEVNALGVDFNALAGIDFRTINSTSVGGTNITPGAVPPRKFDIETAAASSDVSAGIAPGGVSIGVITNSAAVFVRALEEAVDLTIVANPKVLTVNEQPGRVIVGRQDGYLTTTVTETSSIESVEFLETGTQILFRPFISRDGYVRMDIHPEDSSGGLTPENLPYKDTTEVTANVMVRDGHTLVIGGLFREVTSADRTQIPWLGNLPLVGPLFRGTIDAALREEVIVLITPHIIEGDEYSESSAWAWNEIERRRTLAHRGLQFWGRERLAQAHYHWALEHYRAAHMGKALWDLDLALSLNPNFTEASRLRDRLREEETIEPENSIVRNLLMDMLAEEGATPPVEVAPPVDEPQRPDAGDAP
ncbi:MAG: hypothetical protein PVJ57_06715 [Phycisphaerae bacterium]|jgi:type IV pilus assembly protein PilQ